MPAAQAAQLPMDFDGPPPPPADPSTAALRQLRRQIELLQEQLAADVDTLSAHITIIDEKIPPLRPEAEAPAEEPAVDIEALAAAIAAKLPVAPTNTAAPDSDQAVLKGLARDIDTFLRDQAKRPPPPRSSAPVTRLIFLAGIALLVAGIILGFTATQWVRGQVDEWAAFVWKHHGPEVVECYKRANASGQAERCTITANP